MSRFKKSIRDQQQLALDFSAIKSQVQFYYNGKQLGMFADDKAEAGPLFQQQLEKAIMESRCYIASAKRVVQIGMMYGAMFIGALRKQDGRAPYRQIR